MRAKSAKGATRVRVSATIDAELHQWMADRVGPGKEFASVSHALERGIASLQAKEK